MATFSITLLVTVIDDVAPVSLPTIVSCVDLPDNVLVADKGLVETQTDLATTVLLLGTSSSPKKKGVVAPPPP